MAGLALVPVAAGGPPAAAVARSELYPVPPSGVFTLHGRGFGHGHGMSQWGAYGAAEVRGLTAADILHFYYPHTSLAARSTKRIIRVLITAAAAPARGYLEVEPARGLTVTATDGQPLKLATTTPKGRPVQAWRLQQDGATVELRERFNDHWHTAQSVGQGATFTDRAEKIPVVEPGRTVRYRGAMTGEIKAGALEAVNLVNLESYLRSVVPSEMPASWPAAALQAQAVASRTYASRGRKHPKTSWFDVDGDTRDQAYGGVGAETTASNQAVKATAGQVVVDAHDHVILAQFSSANGGWTVSGGVNYLPAQHDPYDGLVPNDAHAWTATVTAAALEAAYPQIGPLEDIVISGRDGHGVWGGRVTTLTLQGTTSAVNLSGTDLQFALGLRSPWFRPVPTPAAPARLKAAAKGKTVTASWQPPSSVKGAAKVTAYRFRLSPGGHRKTLPASARKASVRRLPAGTYTVTVVARSDAGPGPAASMVVKTAHK